MRPDMIEGTNINIRHVLRFDLPRLFPMYNSIGLKGEYEIPRMESPEQFERRLFSDGLSTPAQETLLIVDKENNILGALWHFKSVPTYNAREIGYILYHEHLRGKGIMTEAVLLLADYLFRTELINRLELRIDTRNIASERVATKCGFKKDGVAREAKFIHGRHVDIAEYSLLRREWEENQEKTRRGTSPARVATQ
jgi:[ribosomal protein S5]-alanine N-acetyltransferase